MTINQITWQRTIDIRHKVLWPNKPAEFCKVEGDEQALHFGYFDEEELVSVASIYIDGDKARLRKFATLHAFQGRGIGTRLIEHILLELSQQGISYFWCDARASAVGFYARFGMKPFGEQFYKSGVAYYKMSLRLS